MSASNKVIAVSVVLGALLAIPATLNRSSTQQATSVDSVSAPSVPASEVLKLAAAPSAYTISARSERPEPAEPVTLLEIAQASGDEAPPDLKAKVNAALRENRVILEPRRG